MKWRPLVLCMVGLALAGCDDSVSGFLSCGIEMCSARQVCVDSSTGPTCVCAEGFEGPVCNTCSSGYRRIDSNRCELIPIDCEKNPSICGPHGACVASASGDVCQCEPHYEGALCELCQSGYQDNDSDGTCHPTCAEAGLDCQAPSRCSDAGGTAVCECPTGYTGDDCSRCALGYYDTGTTCLPTCEAISLNCGQTQVCVDTPLGPRCECAEGYAGAGCNSCAQGYREDPSTGSCLPSCEGAENSCGEHGRCDDSVGFAHCVCELGYGGEGCAQCIDPFEASGSGTCERVLTSAETLVMTASYQARSVLATLDPSTGAALPLVELSPTGLTSGSAAQTLLYNQAGTITQLTLPAGTEEVTVASSGAVGPLSWDAALGRLYALGGQAPFRLLSIDPASKVVIELFDTNLPGVADLAFDESQNRLLALRDTLHAISLDDGAVTELGALPPGTVGIELSTDGTLLALSATDAADEATSRVQACRTTAARLSISGYPSATGRFIEPAFDVEAVEVQAATTSEREVLSYLGRGGNTLPRNIEIAVHNPEAFICLAIEESTRIHLPADVKFRALVAYAADATVELVLDAGVSFPSSPRIFLGGYAPSFMHPERDDIVVYTPQEWRALKLPVDARFHQPGPGVLHTLDAALSVTASVTLSGAVVPSGSLSAWEPVAP